jgi:multiple sugar transport system permease protein
MAGSAVPVDTRRLGPDGLLRRMYKGRAGYFFLAPHFIFFAVFFLIPFFQGLYFSFFRYNLGTFQFWGLKGYVRLLSERLFWVALRNTAYYTLAIVPLWLFKALIISVMLFPFSSRVQTFYKALFYLPHVASTVIISLIWLWIYNPQFGLLNAGLRSIGLPEQVWLGNKYLAMPSVIVMQFVMGGGTTIVLLSAALAGLPNEYIEVARIEGANPVQVFLRIMLPLIRPVILYLVVIGTINSFQVFDQVFVLTKGGPEFSTVTMVYQIYERAFVTFDFGLALSESVILMLILMGFAVIQFRFLGGGVEY